MKSFPGIICYSTRSCQDFELIIVDVVRIWHHAEYLSANYMTSLIHRYLSQILFSHQTYEKSFSIWHIFIYENYINI